METIYAELLRRGAADHCYVLSDSSLDAQHVPLEDALNDIVGASDGTFVSCLPCKLAYFEARNRTSATSSSAQIETAAVACHSATLAQPCVICQQLGYARAMGSSEPAEDHGVRVGTSRIRGLDSRGLGAP